MGTPAWPPRFCTPSPSPWFYGPFHLIAAPRSFFFLGGRCHLALLPCSRSPRGCVTPWPRAGVRMGSLRSPSHPQNSHLGWERGNLGEIWGGTATLTASRPQALPQHGRVQPLRPAGCHHGQEGGRGPQGQLLPRGHHLRLRQPEALRLHLPHPGWARDAPQPVGVLGAGPQTHLPTPQTHFPPRRA